MKRKVRVLPTAMLRALLLGALILFVLGVLGLYLLGRSAREPVLRPLESPLDDREEPLLLAGEGFEYEVTHEGKKLFEIRADRLLSAREDSFVLQGVSLAVERDDGGRYAISSTHGEYEKESEAALLEGDVVLQGPNGLEMKTEGLELRRRGRVVVSTSPVEFVFADSLVGSAERLLANFAQDSFQLSGKVSIRSMEGQPTPFSLSSKRLAYEQEDRLLRAEGDVELHYGAGRHLTSKRLSVLLTADEKRIQFVRARLEVSGQLRQSLPFEPDRTIFFAGETLSLRYDEEGLLPQSAELESGESIGVSVRIRDESGVARRFIASYITTSFAAGELAQVEAIGGVEILENLAFAPQEAIRLICSESAIARFDRQGELETIDLDGFVDYREQGIQATGLRAKVGHASGQSEIHGDPVVVLAERGSVRAPRLIFSHDRGSVHAFDGVRAEMAPESTFSMVENDAPESDEDLPVRVESREALWIDGGQIEFRDEVRAWQGESFLLAEKLTGDQQTDRLLAEGGVRTVWRPPAEESEAGEETPPPPVEVTAQEMLFDRSSGELTYSGDALAHQEGRILRCQTMNLAMDRKGKVNEIRCSGVARMDDHLSGKKVEGDEATYKPGESVARIVGQPAVMTDLEGTQIRGRVMIYDFETATARIESQAEEDEGIEDDLNEGSAEPDTAPSSADGPTEDVDEIAG